MRVNMKRNMKMIKINKYITHVNIGEALVSGDTSLLNKYEYEDLKRFLQSYISIDFRNTIKWKYVFTPKVNAIWVVIQPIT